jgi:large subunit ribosomal protein L6
MSRLGKKAIQIPEKTEVTVNESSVLVKGPLGEIKIEYNPVVEIKKENNEIILKPVRESLENNSLWGTYWSLITNMIAGVNQEFKKVLIIEGVGYKANAVGKKITLNIGFSHPVDIEIPEGLKAVTEKEKIIISGIDKQKVTQFAAVLRDMKRPEPYKGKGIRYEGEIIRRKEGKKTV